MGDTYLRVLSFNTHLFGTTADSYLAAIWQAKELQFLLWDDENRKHHLIHYLSQTPPLIDLFVLQEVWSGTFAHDFRDDLRVSFPSFHSRDRPEKKSFFKSGLIMQAIDGISFADASHYNYDDCKKDGLDSQDAHAHKGFLFATATLDSDFDSAIPAGSTIPFGVMGTHMITNQGTYVETTTCCYTQMNAQLQTFANQNLPALLLADLNTPERTDATSEYTRYVYGDLYNFGALDVGISEAYVDSRIMSYPSAVLPVMCYVSSDIPTRFLFSINVEQSTSGWELLTIPFYVPADGAGQTPVYLYNRVLISGAGNDYRLDTSSTPEPGWTSLGVAFYSVPSTSGQAIPIYEWTVTNGDMTFYAYFPEGTSVPTGWTMGDVAFYGIGLLQNDPGYTIDSLTNTLWAKVNLPFWEDPDKPDQQRIDNIFHTSPAAATTTFEVVYASILAQEPQLRLGGTLDLSDHFPIFAIIKVSDPSINSSGVVPVLCYTYSNRYMYSPDVAPRATGWQLVCAPFFVPANNAGGVTVYNYDLALADGNHNRLSTDANLINDDPSMKGWTLQANAFNAVQASTPNAVPIYEWTLVSGSVTLYAYFPIDSGTFMLSGWTMGAIAFYAITRGKLA